MDEMGKWKYEGNILSAISSWREILIGLALGLSRLLHYLFHITFSVFIFQNFPFFIFEPNFFGAYIIICELYEQTISFTIILSVFSLKLSFLSFITICILYYKFLFWDFGIILFWTFYFLDQVGKKMKSRFSWFIGRCHWSDLFSRGLSKPDIVSTSI